MRRLLALVLGSFLVLAACGDDGDSGGPSGDAARYCDAIEGFQNLQNELESPDLDPGASPEEQFAAMQDSFRQLRDRVEELKGTAPAEIKDDIDALVDAAIELIDLFLDIDDPTDLAANQETLQRMQELQTELQGAQERVRAFTEEECGIDIDADEGTPAPEGEIPEGEIPEGELPEGDVPDGQAPPPEDEAPTGE